MKIKDKFTELETHEGALIAYICAGDPAHKATGILENYTNIDPIIEYSEKEGYR